MPPDVAPLNEPSLKLSVYVPLELSIRLLKLATPLTTAAELVLPLANPAGPLATATLIVELSFVMTFPN
jgi:hypothetical protein